MTATQGDLLADAGITQAEQNADADWLIAARKVVWVLIQQGQPFTTDDVWRRLALQDVQTHEPRALGSVMKAAARAGYIRNSGEYVKSTRPDCHSRPVPKWVVVRKAEAA